MRYAEREDIENLDASRLRADLAEVYALQRSRSSHQRVTAMLTDDVLLKRAQDRLDELNQQENDERAKWQVQEETVRRRNKDELQQFWAGQAEIQERRSLGVRIWHSMTQELILAIAILASYGGLLIVMYLDSPSLAAVTGFICAASLGYGVKVIVEYIRS